MGVLGSRVDEYVILLAMAKFSSMEFVSYCIPKNNIQKWVWWSGWGRGVMGSLFEKHRLRGMGRLHGMCIWGRDVCKVIVTLFWWGQKETQVFHYIQNMRVTQRAGSLPARSSEANPLFVIFLSFGCYSQLFGREILRPYSLIIAQEERTLSDLFLW